MLGFGCMRLPVHDGDVARINEEESTRMLRKAIDRGLNYIDTAWPYHGGMSEAFVGRALQEGYRDKVKLATKLPSWLIEKEADMDSYLDQQLERLQTAQIDYYLVHALNPSYWKTLKEHRLFAFLDRALADGRIRNAGFSFHDELDLFKEIVDAYHWDFCQIQYNYLDEEYQAGKEGLEYAASKGMGVVIMEPLRGGALAGDLPEEVNQAFSLTSTAKSPVAWSLNWIWNHPGVSIVLSGMSTMEQVEENLALADRLPDPPLDAKDLQIVEEVKELFRKRIRVNCTQCYYCMPCPHDIHIPRNFFYFNDHAKFDSEAGKNRVRFIYGVSLKEHERASQCIECGECLEKCPQHIPIPDRLKEVAELFEQK